MWEKQSAFSELKSGCNKVELLVMHFEGGQNHHYSSLVRGWRTSATSCLRIP